MPKIKVSDRVQMVMSYHILFDQYEEERLAGEIFRIHEIGDRTVLFG